MIHLALTTHNKGRCQTIISPWSVEFDEGESFGYSLLKVVLIQDQNTGLQTERGQEYKLELYGSVFFLAMTTLLHYCIYYSVTGVRASELCAQVMFPSNAHIISLIKDMQNPGII